MPVALTPLELTDTQVNKIKEKIQSRTIEDESTGCWIWQGATTRGYGMMGVPLTRKTRNAHVLAYFAWFGYPGDGLTLDHEVCDNTSCCNPEHLVPKPTWDNTKRSETNPFAVKSRATHCVNGHEFTEENTYIHPQRGTRHCHECKRNTWNRYWEKQTAKRDGIVRTFNEILNREEQHEW